MPKPLSTDLRRRIIASYLAGEGTYAEVAARFGVGEASVSRLLRRAREDRPVEPKQATGGPRFIIGEDQLRELRELVEAMPGATREDFCDAWRERTGVAMSVASMGRALARAGVTRKKTSKVASEQLRPDVLERRAEFLEELLCIPPQRLVFLDESGCNLAMGPRYGWALSGTPAVEFRPANWGKNVTMVAAITLEGIIADDQFQGSMNKERFLCFITEKLCPELLPGDVVVMDNLRAHKGRDVADAIEAMGAKVLFLPPYSPELNPIEMMWHVIKVALRKMRARTVERLFVGIRQALESVDLSYFSAWFAHCGYPQPS